MSSTYFSPVFAASLSFNICERFLLELLRKNYFGHIFFILMAEQKDKLYHYCHTARVYKDFINIRVHLKVKCHITESRKFAIIRAFLIKTSEGKHNAFK